jgi:hypothetical protein
VSRGRGKKGKRTRKKSACTERKLCGDQLEGKKKKRLPKNQRRG